MAHLNKASRNQGLKVLHMVSSCYRLSVLIQWHKALTQRLKGQRWRRVVAFCIPTPNGGKKNTHWLPLNKCLPIKTADLRNPMCDLSTGCRHVNHIPAEQRSSPHIQDSTINFSHWSASDSDIRPWHTATPLYLRVIESENEEKESLRNVLISG